MTAVSDMTEIWKAFVFWRFQSVIYENTKLIWLSGPENDICEIYFRMDVRGVIKWSYFGSPISSDF